MEAVKIASRLAAARVTVVEALAAGLATLVATTVAVLDFEAVNNPLLEIVPPDAAQVTPTLLVPLTVAVNCMVPPAEICGFAGEIFTLTLFCEGCVGVEP
jgi:hypothetical protein